MIAAVKVNNSNSNAIERVDSGATDESPFGSSLTTPVDENVQLFHGIEHRLLAKGEIGALGTSGSAIYIGEQDGLDSPPQSRHFSNAALNSQEFSKGLFENTKLSDLGPLTPVSTVYVPPDDSNDVDRRLEGSEPENRPRSSSIYTLPNQPINVEVAHADSEENSPSHTLNPPVDDEGDNPKQEDDPLVEGVVPSGDAPFAPPETDSIYTQFPSISRQNLLPTIIRIIIFLPWCVAVGGTILLYPKHLDLVAFGPGYIKTPNGIHRFAHWADSGMHHVGIFLAFIATIGWTFPTFGLLLAGGLVAQFVYAWQDFVVDPSIPLGADDRQTMYIVATRFGLSGNAGFSKKQDSYFLSLLGKEEVVVGDSDEEL